MVNGILSPLCCPTINDGVGKGEIAKLLPFLFNNNKK